MLRVRYAQVPVVAAVRGIALGGGCETGASTRRGASRRWRRYMGLVEVGVGLVPGGGGLAYIARRAAEMAAAGNANADIFKFLTDGFTNAAMAKVGTSAIESRKLGYLLWSDVIVPHKDELLYVAIAAGQGDGRRAAGARRRRRCSRWPAATRSRRSRRSSPTCATAASSARTTSTSRR